MPAPLFGALASLDPDCVERFFPDHKISISSRRELAATRTSVPRRSAFDPSISIALYEKESA
jgi:hypothetical protein